MKHDNCILTRGIKHFNCCNCGKTSTNYTNGVAICMGCLDKLNLCAICGESLENDYDKVAEILNNMAVNIIGLVDNDFEKEYKIWEVFELINNTPNLRFVCSIDESIVWKYDRGYETLISDGSKVVAFDGAIEDNYNLIKLMQSTFKIVKW